MSELVKAIKKYYKRNHIEPSNYREFGCPDKSSCRGSCDRLTTGKEPFIGSRYERRDLPRLLIISADPPEGDPRDWRERTVENGRWWERGEMDWMKNKGNYPRTHWFKTNQTAIWIFEVFKTRNLSRWVWDDHDREFEAVAPYWAHTNSGKCSQNRDGHQQASGRLFKNCRKYLGREIRILAPDIIVTQGVQAREAIEAAIDWKELDVKKGGAAESGSSKLLMLDGRLILWIAMPHPNSHRIFYDQIEKRLPYWSERIKAFLKDSGWYL